MKSNRLREKWEMNKVIYALVNSDAGVFYVGQTVDLDRRLSNHAQGHKKYDHLPLKQAINKHGFATFEIRVLEEVSEGEAQFAEARWMEKLAADFSGWACLNVKRPKNVKPQRKFTQARMVKLTAKVVAEVRHLLRDGTLTQRQIADAYNIAQPTVSRIKNGDHALIGHE